MQVFAYGLLRPGEVYWPRLQPAVRDQRPAQVRGRLYLHSGGGYPLLVCEDDGWVRGELFEVDDAPAVHALVVMELVAGYDARWLPVWAVTPKAPLGEALAFCWARGTDERGPAIASGDWRRR